MTYRALTSALRNCHAMTQRSLRCGAGIVGQRVGVRGFRRQPPPSLHIHVADKRILVHSGLRNQIRSAQQVGSRTLTSRGQPVPLVQSEFAILNLFTTAPGRIFSKEAIARRIWPDEPPRPAIVGLWVHRLRSRIERDVSAPELIQTIRTKGYVFRPEVGMPDPRALLKHDRLVAQSSAASIPTGVS